jgi:hypothetical protein
MSPCRRPILCCTCLCSVSIMLDNIVENFGGTVKQTGNSMSVNVLKCLFKINI